MVTSVQKSKEAILGMLEGISKVFLVGCGECATVCKSGGENEIAALKVMLESHGKEVTGHIVCKTPCSAPQAKIDLARNRDKIAEAEAVMVASCGLGVQSIKENSRADKHFLPLCDTKFIATYDAQGRLKEYCSACGECVLDETAGICPLTRCSKGMLNGPCGGMSKGKCEVDRQRDCAWVMIYQELEKKGKESLMRKIKDAKDYSRLNKPRILS